MGSGPARFRKDFVDNAMCGVKASPPRSSYAANLKSRRARRALVLSVLPKFAGTVTAVLDFWLGESGWPNLTVPPSPSVFQAFSSTFLGFLLLHRGVLWSQTLALRAFPRCDNGVIHGINEVIYPGWSETDASTQDGTGQTMNV